MKTNFKELKPCKKQIDIELSETEVREGFESVYRDINKEKVVPGFRKGKTPRSLLEKYYVDDARREAVRRLVSVSYPRAIEKEGIAIVGSPQITDVHFDESGRFFYKAIVETYPEVNLPKYKGIAIKSAKIEVTEEDMSRALESLAQANAQAVPGNNETKNIEVPAINEDFARDLGFENLETLKKKVKDDLLKLKESKLNEDMKNQLYTHLLCKSSFSLPEGVVKMQRNYVKTRMMVRLILSGMKEDEAKLKVNESQSIIDEEAVKTTKLFFILDEIARKENIHVLENDIEEKLKILAERWRQDVNKVKEYFDKQGLWGELLAEIRYDKVVKLLMKEVLLQNE